MKLEETSMQEKEKETPRPELGPGEPAEGPRGPASASRFALVLMVTLLVYWSWSSIMDNQEGGPRVTYTTFLALVEAGSVERVTLQDQHVQGDLRRSTVVQAASGETVETSEFQTNLPAVEDPDLLPLLQEREVELDVLEPAESSWWATVLLSILPLFLIFGIWIYLMQRMRGGGQGLLSIGRSGARLYDPGKEDTTFDDVAGAHSAKQELGEIIEFLQTPERFRRLGAEIPKGVLLVGPPGTGKTLLARAVAGEADVPFFSITGADFMEMFVGVGPKRVRDLFQSAKEAAPSIIFIDELDAIGGRRGAGVWVGGTDERERTLNQLLSEMSGFEASENVIVMAATNRPYIPMRRYFVPAASIGASP